MIVGVAPDKQIKGLDGPDDLQSVRALECLPMAEALDQEWDTDAHMVCYQVQGEDTYPRINKAGEAWLRAQSVQVTTQYLVIDLDNPDHKAWAEFGMGRQQELLEAVVAAGDKCEAIGKLGWWYFTRSGGRAVYQLSEALPVVGSEDRWRWLNEQWVMAGFDGNTLPWTSDEACQDWTRLFRLPKVIRDDVRTWEETYFDMLATGEVLNLSMVGRRTKREAMQESHQRVVIRASMPDPEECETMMRTATGKWSTWAKHCRKRLRGRDCYDVIFEGSKLQPGERDSTLTRLIGEAVGMLITSQDATPERIYALFYELVCSLEPDEGTPNWETSAWGKVVRFYEQESGKRLAAEKAVRTTSEKAVEEMPSLAAGVRTWAPPEVCELSDEAVEQWAVGKALAVAGSEVYLLGTNGLYEPVPLRDRQIIPRIKESGMMHYLPITTISEDGAVRYRSKDTLINEHGTVISGIRCSTQGKHGATIERIGQADAMLNMTIYRRNEDLEPRFDPEVDYWLQLFFGEEHYEKGCKWIGHALAFDEGPICALSMTGASSAGKHLIAQGLAECLRTPALATAEDMTGQWNYGLLRSPFLFVDEGWPRRTTFACHPSDAFRRLVAGEEVQVKTKGSAPITLNVPVRILLASNNDDMVAELGFGKTLSPEDRDALGKRLFALRVREEPAKWLASKGGLQFTGRRGHRWVAPATGGESDFIVARHFMHLYHNRPAADRGRFLVMGETSSETMHELRINSGDIPVVAEAIKEMIYDYRELPVGATRPKGMEGIFIDKSQVQRGLPVDVYVTTGGVYDYYQHAIYKPGRTQLSVRNVTDCLKSLTFKMAEYTFVPNVRENKAICRPARWHHLDMTVMLELIERYGWNGGSEVDDMIISDKRLQLVKEGRYER